jgi:hypothetical protein
MLERRISPQDVRHVVEHGQVVETYPDDQPFPAWLLLGYRNDRAAEPIHVVLGYDSRADTGYVVTAYVPHQGQWFPDWRTRR